MANGDYVYFDPMANDQTIIKQVNISARDTSNRREGGLLLTCMVESWTIVKVCEK